VPAASDAELDIDAALLAARQGAADGFSALFRVYHHRLLRYLRATEPRMADDLVAEVWVAVAERIAGFEGDAAAFSAWLFTIARNRLADARRRAARRRTDPVAVVPEPMAVHVEDVVIDRLDAQQAAALVVAVLSPVQAEVVLLRTLGGLHNAEIAAMLGRTETWVRVVHHRALKRLRVHLGEA